MSKFQTLLDEKITVVIATDREGLLALSKSLDLVASMGILPLEVCVFCNEVAASIAKEAGMSNEFIQLKPDEFWASFIPCPQGQGLSKAHHKKQILNTFSKHRADWRKLWTV